MIRFQALLVSLFFVSQLTAQYSSVYDVPNPKSAGNGYISNPDRIMDESDVVAVNNILADLEQRDSFQVAVVVLNSIGENVPKDFATDLFEHWRIGNRDRDDGLLLLFVNDQRRVEIETGDGTETVLSDVESKNILTEYMVPLFKENRYSEGLLSGIQEIARELEGETVDTYHTHENETTISEFKVVQEAKERRNKIIYNRILYAASWHAIGLILFLITLVIVRYKNDPYDKYRIIRFFHMWIWAVLFPITHIFIVLLSKKLKNRYRNMIRFSGKSGEIMRKLEESDEDEYLSKGQITEELVQSVDYDVWITDKNDDTLILEYRPLFSKYTKCPKCRFRTYYKVYDRQIVSPTYYSRGQGERKHACKNCRHVDLKKYSIAKLQRSSRASSSGGGWSGSSRSGGSSWGGGGSSGGGAGASW